jgi:Ni/Co efflux regulator RcnB
MKRMILLLAAVASVASAMPLAAPAFARDGDQGRRAERHEGRGGGQRSERGGYERRGGQGQERGQERGQDRSGQRWQAQDRRDDGGDRRRYEERPRYEERRRDDDRPRPEYRDSPRPNYMSPAPGVSGRRGYAPPESYRGGVVDDYRRYRLRPPPQGYDWVRMGNGFGLVERGSGRIYDRVN